MNKSEIAGNTGCLVVLFIVGGLFFSCSTIGSKTAHDRYSAKLKECKQFGDGKIINTFSFMTGNKNANYCSHYRVVLENKNGERLEVIPRDGDCPAIGDIWSITVEPPPPLVLFQSDYHLTIRLDERKKE